MKILLVSLNHHPEQTGIGKFQGEMAAWFAARGHDVRVIAAPPYYPAWNVGEGYSACRYKYEKIGRVAVWRVPLYVPSTPGGLKRLLHLFSFAVTSLPLILWQGLRWRPHIILTTAPPLLAAPSSLLAAKLCGAKAWLHMQDFEVDAAFGLGLLKGGFASKLAYGFERALLRAFPAVSTISRRMKERLIEKGVPPARAFLIPNWAGVEDFDPAQANGLWQPVLKKDPRTVVALYSGNLGRKQGVETIVEAARLLKGDQHIRIVICGDGAARKEMEESAAGLINLTFLPLQSNDAFIQLMLAADIHLLPQRAEAADLVMPSKLGNILASGKPLVAGAVAGTQLFDAVTGCGIAVPPDDAPAFAAAIATLAADPEARAEMGRQGRRQAAEQWSRDGILMRLENLLVGEP